MTSLVVPTTELGADDTVALLACQTRVLALMSSGAALTQMLDVITGGLERLLPGSWCSLLLRDEHGALRHGSAPSLPGSYLDAIDGLVPGPTEGSCGTAAYLAAPVVAVDIDTDHRWDGYRVVAHAAGLRSCWSTPVLGSDARVVGTFAVYHPDPHRPTPREQRVVERLTYLASVAIGHAANVGARLEAEVAQRSAEAASRAKSAFLSAISHEMRTPLQAITGFAELLGTLDLDAERRAEALRHVAAGATHLLELVDETLDLSRIEAGALPLTMQTLPVPGIVADVVDLLEPLAAEQGVRLNAEPPVARVTADALRLRQVLINLVSNGIRYSGPGGAVCVTGSTAAEEVRIVVADNGPGIASDLRDRLFEPFAHGPHESGDGVGLGLMLARGLTEAMGGRLTIDDAPGGRGTVATVALSLA